jgi:hypothetical protein
VIEATNELVGMSKRLSEQTTAMDKLRAEFDDYRSRSKQPTGATGASLARPMTSDRGTSGPLTSG